jgi:hypothetical protein
VLTKDDICTLIDIDIANLIWVDLFSWSFATQGFVVFDVTQIKEMSYRNCHPINQFLPFNNWSMWLLTQTCWCVFTRLCQCHLELKGDKKLSSFYFGHFSSSKNFNHIKKGANVFHLKLGGSHWLNFLTSIPSKHTCHHHGRSIASC